MKKTIAKILSFIVILTSLTATVQAAGTKEFAISFNGLALDNAAVVLDNTYYVPVRCIFEKMGAQVFYRGRDRVILALSRDGDMIYHTVCDNKITVNGEEKIFKNASISQNNQTYIPIEMLSVALCPDAIFYDNQQLSIRKYMFNSDYHKNIKDVLDVCRNDNFYPERFQRYVSYHTKMPDYSIAEVISRVNLGFDYPFYENVKTIENPHELLVLVNKYNQLPAGFEQYNLVEMDRNYTLNDGKAYLLNAAAYEKYLQMYDAAKREGLTLRVISAYRTENYQRNLYNKKLRTSGKAYAEKYSARAGHSEHQTGLAVDIGATKTTFEHSREFKWMQQHAHEYGFILRYPKDKEWLTGYAYEPWHYRYVGTDAAAIIHNEGITYEEFYAKYVSVNEFV